MSWKLLVICSALIGSAAAAAPSVFIPAGKSAWWNAVDAKGRVIGTSAGSVTAAQLSKITEAEVYSPYKVCSLSAVVSDTFVGLDKEKQDEIVRTLKTIHWRVDSTTPGGRQITAQSVIYEACDDPDNRGAAVLVTDHNSSEILMFRRMGVFTENSNPIWTAFLSKPEVGEDDPPLFSYSHCTECGAATNVYYDVTRKKLYGVYNDH